MPIQSCSTLPLARLTAKLTSSKVPVSPMEGFGLDSGFVIVFLFIVVVLLFSIYILMQLISLQYGHNTLKLLFQGGCSDRILRNFFPRDKDQFAACLFHLIFRFVIKCSRLSINCPAEPNRCNYYP